MADIKISSLTAITSVSDADIIPLVQSGVTKRTTAYLLASAVMGAIVLSAPSSGSSNTILQAGVTSAQSAGVPLILRDGTYTITPAASGAIRITSTLSIIAAPNAHVIAATAGSYTSTDMINVQSDNVTFDGGIWDWNSVAGSGNFIVNASSHTNIVWKNGIYKNAVYGCIQATDCNRVKCDNNAFSNNQGGDINVICAGADVNTVDIHDNYHSCPASNYEAVNVVNLSGNTKFLYNISVRGNIILGSIAPSVGSCGIQIWANSSNYDPGPFIIADNIVKGFEIGYSPAFCTVGSVTGNVCWASKTIGFEMAGSNIVCTGNVCDGDQNTQYGFTTDGAPEGNFSGNSARDCILYAFSVTNGGSNDAVFTGCHAYQSVAAGAYSAFAIFSIANVTLSGCHVNYALSTAGLGVYAVDVGNLTITGCRFSLASGTLGHIYIDNSTGTIRDNIKIKNNSYSGAVTGGNVHLVGTSYGTNIDIEGLSNGAVTQASSKSTAVTKTNKFQVDITMNNAALNAATIVSFSWPSDFMTVDDTVTIQHVSGGTIGAYTFNAVCGALSTTIYVRNATAGNLSEAIVLRCVHTKSKST